MGRAHNNLRMRGQAFVSFESPDAAAKALKEVRGFPLYSKPMVRAVRLVFPLASIDTRASANLIRAVAVGCGGAKVGCGQL